MANITRQAICLGEALKWPPNIGISRADSRTTLNTDIRQSPLTHYLLRRSEGESAAIGAEHLPGLELM
jgi:hypothetical protein